MVKFDNKSKSKTEEGKDKKSFDIVNAPYEGRELTPNAFRSGVLQIKATNLKNSKC